MAVGNGPGWARRIAPLVGCVAFVGGLSLVLSDHVASGGLGTAVGVSLFGGALYLNSRDGRSAGRGPRNPPPTARTSPAMKQTFVTATVVTPAGRPKQPALSVPDPLAVTRNGLRFTVDRTGFVVHRQVKSPGGGQRWVTHVRMSWQDVAQLGFDSDRHDPTLALYAVRTAGGREHVADSRSFTTAQWTDLASGVGTLSRGRLSIDLGRREYPGSPHDS
jgi:hypothetical protein